MNFDYNATTGNLESVAAPGNINLAYGYDGALLKSQTWSGAITGGVNYTYDENFRWKTMDVNGSDPIAFVYDNDGLLNKVGDLTLTPNPQTSLLDGSALGSVSDSWSYNDFGEPVSYRVPDLFTVQYDDRDALGRITKKTETIGGVTTVYEYDYDTAGRLWHVKTNNTLTATYEYDSNGNRLSVARPSGIARGTYDEQDRLLTYGSATYTYTANGELQVKQDGNQTTQYEYDELGNLLSVTLPDGKEITYLVDGQGRRVGKQVNGLVQQGFLYESQLRPAAELDGNGNLVSRFVYATRVNVPDYMIRDGITYRFILDHLGSPRLIVNVDDGTIAQRLDYDEFGEVVQDTNPGFQPFGFAGGLYDSDTDLVRFGVRDYGADFGRWLVKDPIGFLGGPTNLYLYARGNPNTWVDPSGFEDDFPSALNNNYDENIKNCSGFVRAVLHSIGSPVPEKNANDLFDWFSSGPGDWKKLNSEEEAIQRALAGDIVIAAYKNPTGKSGHITFVTGELNKRAKIYGTSSAGYVSKGNKDLSQIFGKNPVSFFALPNTKTCSDTCSE